MPASAGILLYRKRDGVLEVLIAHPGGPMWAGRDEGAWSIPKGEIHPGEEPEAAARREFAEETGHAAPSGNPLPLGTIRQRAGKTVHAFAFEGDLDPDSLISNRIEITWPPRTGHRVTIPEIDRVLWAEPAVARAKLNPAQVVFIDRLVAAIGH